MNNHPAFHTVAIPLARRRAVARAFLILAAVLATAPAAGAELRIDAAFPGGNILVDRIDADRVDLRQDPRDTEGWWFYWSFRVRGAAGRTVAFRFTKGNVIGVRGPAFSTDGGKTWDWLGAGKIQGESFTYAFGPRDDDVRFCLAIPYLEADLRKFLDRHAGDPHLRVQTLAATKKGRSAERLHLGKLQGEPKHRVLVTCRHHACEMMASWAVEGLMEEVLGGGEDGKWLRENVEFLVAPFVDKDGVEDGDQGKNRRPHDHNRDYLGPGIHPSVKAIREFVPAWSKGKLAVALDMHCPWIRGGGNEEIMLVGNPEPAIWAQQQVFGRILHEAGRGERPGSREAGKGASASPARLLHDPKQIIPHGTSWNTDKQPRTFARWAATLSGVRLATTVEIPYANAGGRPVTAQSAHDFGRDLARAVRAYLER